VRVCVFCGSSPGVREAYLAAARSLGSLLAERGIGLVYGGASVGLMGEVADAALAGGGEAIGVIPRRLVDRELAHAGLTELHVVETMHERKALMAKLSDAFVILPGGAGTLDEFFEALTWRQLGLHAKPLALLDVDGFFGPLLGLVDHLVEEGFVQAAFRAVLLVERHPAALLDRLER
jgi:uncharacterized protein (TIGR00730 family)